MNNPEEILLQAEKEPDERKKTDLYNLYAYESRNILPSKSVAVADKAFELSSRLNYLAGKAESLLNIGFYNIQTANHEKAFSALIEALSIFENANDEAGAAKAHYNIGMLHLRVGNFSNATECLHLSLAFREKTGDKAGMASCYFQISYINQHFSDREAAEENCTKAYELRKELNDTVGMAAALMILGEIHLQRKEYEKARRVLSESMDLRKESEEKLGYFATLLRWTELHLVLGEYDKAMEFAMYGFEMAQTENIRFGMMRFMQMMGRIELTRNNIEIAKQHYLGALDYATNLTFKSAQYELHESLREIYKMEGDYKSAFEHFEKFHKIKEEVISLQTNTQLKGVQFMNQVEFARKEALLEKTKNEALQAAYKIIEEKNKDITDSITYAGRIQRTLLTPINYIERNLNRLNQA